jgi:hypothetical protein
MPTIFIFTTATPVGFFVDSNASERTWDEYDSNKRVMIMIATSIMMDIILSLEKSAIMYN